MSKILIIISAVLLVGAGVLGYLNKTKLDEAKAAIQDTKAYIATAEKEKEVAIEEKQQAQELAEEEAAKREAAEAEVTRTQDELKQVASKVAQLESTISEKEQQIAELKENAGSGEGDAGEDTGTGKLAELEAQVKEMETSLAAAEEENKILTEKVQSAQAAADALREAEEQRKAAVMSKSLEGQVLAYNPAWNFVVLNLGDRNGVVANAEMVVKRGGQMVGRVKITSVEPTTSIADVLPSTVSAGMQIQPGDRVIVPVGS